MDVPLQRRSPRWRRALLGGAAIATLGIVTAALAEARRADAPPAVERVGLTIDTVRRGPLLRQVRGFGTLVPEEIRWVTAGSPGRVERIALRPGVSVKADTVLVELANPELAEEAAALEAQARVAAAQRARLALDLENEGLAQEAVVARLRSELGVARFEADGDEQLRAQGFGPELAARRSRAKADDLGARVALEERRAETLRRAGQARLRVQEAELERIQAQRRLRQAELDALTVRAGIDGVLQRLGDEQPLRVGQRVAAGAPLARVASQSRLGAEIKIAETQAKDVQLGQAVEVDTRNGVVAGQVARIDPAVQNATVTVDVALPGPLPAGARPDLSVDGTITLERVDGVLVVGRPVGVQLQGAGVVRLFKVSDGGRAAERVPLRLGRVSVDSVEIAEGARAGDQLVLSDMSPWDGHDRIGLQ
jgi:HlyD family secretion protein